MAFTVAPTSGVAPYTFTASFFKKSLIDNISYSVEFRASSSSGVCPVVGEGADSPTISAGLLNNGIFSINADVATGACRTYTLLIRDLQSGVIVSSRSVSVDNT